MGSFTKKYMSAILPESLGLESIGSAYANFALSDDKQEDRAKIVCGSEKSAALVWLYEPRYSSMKKLMFVCRQKSF